MRLISKVTYAVGIAAAIALTASAADARSRYTTDGAYAYSGDSVPYRGRYFSYGANHAPYGWDQDNSRDFQLQGSN